jgi:catechol 2,3-dioxygenase
MLHLSERTDSPAGAGSPVRVRKLGHVVLWVRDLERSTKFYTDILNFQVSDVNEKGMVFLTACGDHHTIALAQTAADDAGPAGRPGLHHFAMEVDGVDQLLAIREFMRREGVPITFEGRRGAGSNIGIEFRDPDGNALELYCDMDQVVPGQAARPAEQWSRTTSIEDARDRPMPAGW